MDVFDVLVLSFPDAATLTLKENFGLKEFCEKLVGKDIFFGLKEFCLKDF